jgi:hypothetical protein
VKAEIALANQKARDCVSWNVHRLHHEGVTEGVLSVGITGAPRRSPTILEAGSPAGGWQAPKSFFNRQDAQLALPVGME